MKHKVFFFHNSLPEYRMVFWSELNKMCDLELFITNKGLEGKVYKFDNDITNIKFNYYGKCNKKTILSSICETTIVILPPLDTLHEYLIARELIKISKKRHATVLSWTEKWEADWELQPVTKKLKNIIHRYMYRSVLNAVDRCICSGKKAKEYAMMLGINEKKIHIAYDSSTSSTPLMNFDLKAKYGISSDDKVVLFMARVIRRKGCDVLINAFNKMDSKGVYLLISGDGEDLEYCKKISSKNRNIVFTGMVQPSLRKIYYESADVFVLPSICDNGVIEAWGLTVNEALECGTPVIVSDVVGAGFDIVNRENGIIVQNNNENELIEALNRALEVQYDRNQIKSNYEQFNVYNMAKSFYDALKL